MEKKRPVQIESKLVKYVFYFSLAFYIWYLASVLLLPLSGFMNIPDGFYITLYKLADFPVAILGFIICISLISSIIALREFHEKGPFTKLLLIEGISFMLYFIIPIIATILLLVFLILNLLNQIPSAVRISYFLEDLFIFTTVLFLLTAVLNIATHRILEFGHARKN